MPLTPSCQSHSGRVVDERLRIERVGQVDAKVQIQIGARRHGELGAARHVDHVGDARQKVSRGIVRRQIRNERRQIEMEGLLDRNRGAEAESDPQRMAIDRETDRMRRKPERILNRMGNKLQALGGILGERVDLIGEVAGIIDQPADARSNSGSFVLRNENCLSVCRYWSVWVKARTMSAKESWLKSNICTRSALGVTVNVLGSRISVQATDKAGLAGCPLPKNVGIDMDRQRHRRATHGCSAFR